MKVFDSRELLGPGTNWTAFVGAVAIMMVGIAIVSDVLMRWLFNSPILGVDDLSQFNLAVIVSSFFPMCLVGGHNITIRFLGKALGVRASLWLEVWGQSLTLLIFLLLAWQFFRFTLYDVTYTGLATVVLQIPQAPWWWVTTIIIWLCVPLQAVVVFETVIRAIRKEPRSMSEQAADMGV
ncbi:MAG TPA: TRAP transporter small permease subunit [Propylenella sp.]